jgi:hypothetical protein
MQFLRYFCFYCASRFIYSSVRATLRNKPAPASECGHVGGLLVTLVLLPFVGAAALILIGFFTH